MVGGTGCIRRMRRTLSARATGFTVLRLPKRARAEARTLGSSDRADSWRQGDSNLAARHMISASERATGKQALYHAADGAVADLTLFAFIPGRTLSRPRMDTVRCYYFHGDHISAERCL
jgi:hypothetical protein